LAYSGFVGIERMSSIYVELNITRFMLSVWLCAVRAAKLAFWYLFFLVQLHITRNAS
jgi:hypothetical protein